MWCASFCRSCHVVGSCSSCWNQPYTVSFPEINTKINIFFFVQWKPLLAKNKIMKKNKIFFAGFLWNNHDKTCKIFAAKTNFAHLNKTMDIYQRYGSLKKKMDKYFLTRTYVYSRRKKRVYIAMNVILGSNSPCPSDNSNRDEG